MIGETIGAFRITHKLGVGGMGEVWAAEQQIIKTRVAIKLLRDEISTNQQHVQRFFSEAIAVGKIKHSGIVKIFDVGFYARRAFLIMEFLDGEPLTSRIARAGRLPAGAVAEIGRQMASILAATHAEGIVHRDLKPDNVFLVPDAELASKERVKILDFGIAKLGMGLTGTSDTMGTPAYMAPEQWSHAAKVDALADVYSLGCLVFEMCCGRPPFAVGSIAQAYARHRDETPPRASSLVSELPVELDDLIAQMLAKSPADRPSVHHIGATFARIAAAQPRVLDSIVEPRNEPRPLSSPLDSSPLDTTLRGAASSGKVSGEGKQRRWVLTTAVGAGVGITAVAAISMYVASRGDTPGEKPAPLVLADVPSGPPDAPPRPPGSDVIANRWVRIDPPATPYPLGLPDKAPDEQIGFRASRGIVTPSRPYEIQEHEVTWSELEPWLARSGVRIDYPPWAAEARTREALPATNITWSIARAYCQSLGSDLPTEEQWEYAARGPERRPNPWGADPLDLQVTRAFAGSKAAPAPVMTSRQDQTPGLGASIWDLAGNAREWTLGLWRGDRRGLDPNQALHESVSPRG